MKGFLILLIVFYLSFFNAALAANPLDVVINEIAWMGTINSANDEWIELYNNTENLINLDGWQLLTQDGTPKINLSGTIPANGFYLLERTDDNTVPAISADKIYTGALGNSGEALELYDNFGNLIDRVDNSSGWLAGDNKTKQTMERKNPQLEGSNLDNWQTSQNPGGTPRVQNSLVVQIEKEVQESPQIEDATQIVEEKVEPNPQPIIYPSGIVLNEILPSPEGPDEKEEWIEIFNENNFEVDLAGWQITDTAGKIQNYIFPEDAKISSRGFLVISRPESKITLNNDGDGLKIFQPNKNISDEVVYPKAKQGQSFNKISSGWAWSSLLTPGLANQIPGPISEIKKTEPGKDTAPGEETETPQEKRGLAAVSEPLSQARRISESLSVFLIALIIAIFSGIIILVSKKKLKIE